MNWLLITLIAYFLNAIAMVIDKTLLKRDVKNPFVYTFYIAALGAVLMVFILPFGLTWPGASQFIISLLAGATFAIGLFLMFFGLKKEDASRLTPIIGGLTPVFVFALAYLFLGERLLERHIYAFILIVVGAFVVSVNFEKGRVPQMRRALWVALPAAFFFGLSYVLTKDVYNHQSFFSGFVWTRLGVFVTAMLPMLWAKNRHDLTHPPKDANGSGVRTRFLFGQACGGASAILIQYSTSLASVSLVQAMQGVQYVFIFIAVIYLTRYRPNLLKENISAGAITQKVFAILLIALGMYFII
ncbi:MAG TPA: DMT family transporter [bacterium]|nr:DMT family transporter [bacterium]